jgi:hypothetical protein
MLLVFKHSMPPGAIYGVDVHHGVSPGEVNFALPKGGTPGNVGVTDVECFAMQQRAKLNLPAPITAERALPMAANLLASLFAQATPSIADMSINLQQGEDCGCEIDTVPIPKKQPGITIVKKTDPGTSQVFKFAGSLGNFSLDGDENTAFPSSMSFKPAAGTYTIKELGNPVYAIKDIVCTEDGAGSTFTTNGDSATISLTEDGKVTCTFTNAPLGTVVIKVVAPAGPQQYDFTGGLGTFSLDADPSADLQQSKTAILPIGRYVAWPLGNPPAQRQLTDVRCTDPSGNSTADFDSATSTVQLDPGETVVCTYTYVAPAAPIATVQEIAVTHPAAGKTGPAALLAMAAGAAGGMSWMRRRRRAAQRDN